MPSANAANAANDPLQLTSNPYTAIRTHAEDNTLLKMQAAAQA